MRLFTGTCRVADSININIQGWQYSDGSVERTIAIEPNEKYADEHMPAELARLVAATLVEAADELDRLAAGDCTTCASWDSCPRHPRR